MRSLGFNTWLHGYVSYVCAGAFASAINDKARIARHVRRTAAAMQQRFRLR